MDLKVEWSPEALEDTESIAAYIGRDSERYSQAVVSRIVEATRDLAVFPKMGRVVPELSDELLRERLIYSYRLVYRIEPHRILVIAVIHGRRLIDNISTRL